MFASTLSKVFLAIFILIIIGIPIGAYVLSSQQEKAAETPTASPKASAAPSKQPEKITTSPKPSTTTKAASPSATPSSAVAFGPTMDLKVSLEGRPTTYQVAKLFIGIALGQAVVKPTYLLIYSIDLPGDGLYSGLSLAGLTAGTAYSAYLKGPSQIDKAVTFTMASAVTNLNDGAEIKLLSGDLNEDNVINSADYAIASSAFRTNENSTNWNANIDFNRDGVINTIDISFVVKNFGKVGDSGPVGSTPGVASSSGQLRDLPIGGTNEATSTIQPPQPPGQRRGYWLWVPEI